MKNFRKTIFLTLIVLIILMCLIYNYINNNSDEVIEEDVYVNTNEKFALEKNKIIIHIIGEVKFPGIIKIDEGSRLADAIEAAGGATENADVNKINLAYIVQDGQKIKIPNVNSVDTSDYITKEIGENIIIEDITLNTTLVNINTATRNRT